MIEEEVRLGGLFRCCTDTLYKHLRTKEEPSQEGETLDCAYERPGNANLIFRNGAWEWNRPPREGDDIQ